ncbi:MAG TPA: glycosyltransferase family 1 protein [Gemmatimonadales bacterium]|nr:glycosyltransferase family 1 protein [Gemmatimonadales bacterium]
MRLSLVTDTFLPEVNGVTTVLAAMARGLRARDHAVQVVAPAYGGAVDDAAGVYRVPSVACPRYPAVRLSWPIGRGIGGALARFGPDVVHVVTEGPIGAFGHRWARRARVPLVTSFHTDFPRYAAHYLGPWAVKPVCRYLRWFHRQAALTHTPSDVTCAELRALGVPRAVVWGRAVDCTLFRPARRDEHRRRALAPRGEIVVLHVGRLAVEKDVGTLVAAFEYAGAALGSAAALCVAGDGPEAESVRRALPFATHLGFVGRARLADLYADADLFVFPSRTETCGLVALEAMASGLPVIAADQGGVRDNVRDGITGRLVRAGDAEAFGRAIVQLVRDDTERRSMGQAARAFAVTRDWSAALDDLVLHYRAAGQPQGGMTNALTASPGVAPIRCPASTSVG